MKKIIYLFGIALFIASCSNDNKHECSEDKNINEDTLENVCDEVGSNRSSINYNTQTISSLQIRQSSTLNSNRSGETLVWMSVPSLDDWSNQVTGVSFVVQVPANVEVERINMREVLYANSNCKTDHLIYELKLKSSSSANPKPNPSLETFTLNISQADWDKFEFFVAYTSDSQGDKKKVVAANPNTYPDKKK